MPELQRKSSADAPRMTTGGIGPRVAFVFDHWYTPGGGQNELLILLEAFPEAPLFVLLRAKDADWDSTHPMHVSFVNRMPFAHSRPSLYLPLLPAAIESFDFRDFDLVVSFSATWAKGILVAPHTHHICRAFLPMRYGWEAYHDFMAHGLAGEHSGWLSKKLRGHIMSYLRIWDVVSANRVDDFIANSHYVAQIIRRRYRRDADVVYPPVDVEYFVPVISPSAHYYLLVSRLTAYKRIDLAIQAFNKLGWSLKIVGDGHRKSWLRGLAKPNIEFLGKVDRPTLLRLYQHCRALIMPQIEDFGIVAVEAMACGRPVVACGAGGAREIVVDGETGVLFWPQSAEALAEAVIALERNEWDSHLIRQHAQHFRTERFRQEMLARIAVEPSRSPLPAAVAG